MTVIAWDGKTLAADKLGAYGSLRVASDKIHRIGPLLVGGSGESSFIEQMIEWIRGGRVVSAFPAAQASKEDWQPIMVIEADKSISIYERSPYPVKYPQKFMAIGSGRDAAMATMFLGHSAEKAVEVASALIVDCGNGVDTLEFEDEKPAEIYLVQ